jgi:hypothetical protein
MWVCHLKDDLSTPFSMGVLSHMVLNKFSKNSDILVNFG